MTEINYIPALIVPVTQDFLESLPENVYEQLDENTFIFKEGVRIIMATKEPQSNVDWSSLHGNP